MTPALWDARAAKVLRSDFKIDAVPVADGLGANNRTWRSGDLWLTCRPHDRAAYLERETALFERLNSGTGPRSLRAPQIVACCSGRPLVSRFGQRWRLTRHLQGDQPDPRNIAQYPKLARGLADLHRQLDVIGPATAVWPTSILEWGLSLADQGPSALEFGLPLTGTASTGLRRALDTVAAHTHVFTGVRRQLIHGDTSHPNLRVDSQSGELTGVMDLEFCREDPVVMDIGTMGLTVVMRSGALRPELVIEEMVAAYEGHGGTAIDRPAIYVTMLVLKLWSYWHHGHRALRGETGSDLALSQGAKCQAVQAAWDEARRTGLA